MKHPQNLKWDTVFTEQICVIDLLHEQLSKKKHWIRKSSSTCQHKNLSFDESAVLGTYRVSGFRTCSEGLFN